MLNLKPVKALREDDVRKGLKLVIIDGLAAEAMTTLSSGAFLVALALLLGASNFQIGFLAALPTLTNLFQLVSIWLVRRFHNRKAVAVISSIFARIPLLVVAAIPILFPASVGINALIIFITFHYLFGSIAGPSWNAWIKDIVPQQTLGLYFAKRGSYMQVLNVILSLSLAFLIDYIKDEHPGF
jgi:hypothetical protein